jgi:hypothetical protein
MKFKASLILSFLTGRFYCQTGESPTVFLGPLSEYLSGQSQTMFLPKVKDDFSEHILKSIPFGLFTTYVQWVHSDNWMERCNQLDEEFGLIEIPPTSFTKITM